MNKLIHAGAPMSWRAVLGGPVEADTSAAAVNTDEAMGEAQNLESSGPGRGKGRGRGRRDQGGRDDRQETGNSPPSKLSRRGPMEMNARKYRIEERCPSSETIVPVSVH